MRKLAIASLLPFTTGCGLITFDVERDIPEQRVRGNIVTMLLEDLIESPVPMNIDLAQEVKNRDAEQACEAHLLELSFRVTNGGVGPGDTDDFDFVDAVTIDIESTLDGTSLPRTRLASLPMAPDGATTLELQPTSVDLLPYIAEGALITSSATGSPPPDDVTFVGHYVVEVVAL